MKLRILLIVLVIAAIGGFVYRHHSQTAAVAVSSTAKSQKPVAASSIASKSAPLSQVATPATNTPTPCGHNTLSQIIIVSLSSQHMWACAGSKVAYDNPVITGKQDNDDSTPLGDYKIFGHMTDQTLKGCDSGGCWNDPVSYWLPYQQADGGTVGFHDATWRADSEFGNTPPASNKGSHGCVEMPLAAAKWLYDWSSVGTPVAIRT